MASPPIILNNNEQMKKITKENRFDEAIKALVKGYFEESLIRGSCAACAVGNIIANAMNEDIIVTKGVTGSVKDYGTWKGGFNILESWFTVFGSRGMFGEQYILESNYRGVPREQIDSTGYSYKELARVEKAFESKGEDMFTGLMAVVDVLCEIEGKSQEEAKEYKEMFVKE